MSKGQVLKFTDTLNDVFDGVYISDNEYVIRFMNAVMMKICGDDGIGKKCYEFVRGRNNICPRCDLMRSVDDSLSYREPDILNVNGSYELFVIPICGVGGNFVKLGIYRNVVANKNQDQCIRVYKDDYKRIFDHVGVGVFISSKEGRFIDANPALLNMLGYHNKEQFLKLDLEQDLYLRSEERIEIQKMIEAKSNVEGYSVIWKRNDSKTVSVQLTAHARYDTTGKIIGYEGICVDQSQRLKMEKVLRETHLFLNKTIQSSPNAIIATDMAGNIIIWNRGAEETFKYSSEEVVGHMNVMDLYHDDVAKKVMKMIRSKEYGGKGKLRAYPMTLMAKDGRPVEGSFSANIIYNEQVEEMASVGIFVDLMEQLSMERKLRSTQEQLLQSEKLAAMGRLTSQIAHELNNPLFGIMNTFELLKTEIKPSNKRRKLLDMALSETERLAEMLRKMLSFSKPDQEQRSFLDVNTILDEILLLCKKQLSEYSIKTSSDMDRTLHKLYASKNQLRQVFLNMISNAREAMPNGGTLTITTKNKGSCVLINISDTGTGIKKEHLDLIFEAFFTTKTDSVKGVGLGLSVCYGFIKDHDGDIKVDSRVGTGTSFSIILPSSCDKGPIVRNA